MTTTQHLQKFPEFFNSIQEFKNADHDIRQTNPRYSNFLQGHFTAGDSQQFQIYRDKSNNDNEKEIRTTDNFVFDFWEKYRNLDALSVDNTFNYLFNKFKKGLFIKIKNNKLDVFLPFSKHNFVNEWGNRIETRNIINFFQYIQDLQNNFSNKKYQFNPNKVNIEATEWYSNNCLIRYEKPINEGDTGIISMKHMLETLCANRKVPDIEFFINRRDFPLIKRDGTEAYNHVFDSDNLPLVSHNYSKYSPIFSMVTTDKFADIAIPTSEDWNRVVAKEKIVLDDMIFEDESKYDLPWNEKKPIAVFRGSSTGCGVTSETNTRLHLAKLSYENIKDTDGLPFLDAGITEWNLRPRKLQSEKKLTTINVNNLEFDLVKKMSTIEQSKYKYIINVDGHVTAFRLSRELSMNSVIFIVDSEYKLWFQNLLKPYKHYIPIKADLSDLIDRIKWAKSHDKECEEIAKNAKQFYNTYLQKEGVLNYLQELIGKLKKVTGVYLYNNPVEIQINSQIKLMENDHNIYPKDIFSGIFNAPTQSRTFGLLQGMRWVYNKAIHENIFKLSNISNLHDNIIRGEFAGYKMVIKSMTSSDKYMEQIKKNEIINEAFIGTRCTNKLIKFIPNFSYIFGLKKDEDEKEFSYSIVSEYITSMTFLKYIDSKDFSVNNYFLILIQLCFALQMAQEITGFVHNDLTPWNILIQQMKESISVSYLVKGEVLSIKTNLIPIIIDYGKSHGIYKSCHYGLINKSSSIQDILGILITSLSPVIKRISNENDMKKIIQMTNFISGTKYYNKTFETIDDIMLFLSHASKYDELLYSNKHELEERNPMDFYRWIEGMYGGKVVKKSDSAFFLNKGNARQVFEYTLSDNDNDRVESFKKVFYRVMKSTLPQPKNILSLYFSAHSLLHNLDSVLSNLKKFTKKEDKDYPELIDIKKFLHNLYTRLIETEELQEIEFDLIKPVFIPYDDKIFSNEVEVKYLLEKYDIQSSFQTKYKNMTLQILTNPEPFRIPDKIRDFYRKNLEELFISPSFGEVDLVTLKDIYEKIRN